ncbi:glycosyltransferase [Candidatus Dependentiae bacterium]|nr:glycosyltransferase [Candidatus Dependentiae bacterium]
MSNEAISIISPLFNEEENIEQHYHEICSVIKKLKHFNSYEIIMVNDGSSDNSLNILKNLAKQDPNLKIISFTRNFGHEAASSAGLKYASGKVAVLIDADRQDPPELILEFEKEFLNGYHIVYGQRKKRLKETFIKKITSKAFYPIFKWITKVDMPKDTGDFCLLSRKALDAINQLPENNRFVRGLIYWTGLPKKAIFFIRRSRGGGNTKYNYSKLTIFALENIISFSIVPIYFIIFFSLFIIMTCSIGTITALILKLLGFVAITGWTSIIISMLFLFSFTFLFLGILGLYIGKIFQEIKQRPLFLINEKINFEEEIINYSYASNNKFHIRSNL